MTRVVLAFLFAMICVLSMPIAAAAQRGGGQGRGGGFGRPQIGTVSPPVTPAPPSINRPSFPLDGLNRPSFPLDGLNRPSFPLQGPLGMGPVPPSPFDARPRTFAPRFNTRSRGPRAFGIPLGYGFGLPAYVDTYPRDTRAPAREEEIVNGVLYLDVTPRTAMVFIDTAFVGSVEDVLVNGVTLSRGRHWLEIEAPEYEKKLIEIVITPGQPLRYRVDLTPVRRAALTVIPPRPPETMYAIPGCYGGNRPPVAAALPQGCDIAKVRVLRPPRPN